MRTRPFQRDWHAMANEVRKLIRAHPADPAAFEGIILLPGLMRSLLDDDHLVKIVRDHFMNDPRMGQLCDAVCLPERRLVGKTSSRMSPPGTLTARSADRPPTRSGCGGAWARHHDPGAGPQRVRNASAPGRGEAILHAGLRGLR